VKKPIYKDLFFQVVVAILLGIALGCASPATAISMKPLGDAFISLIKMMIAPIIFCTIVSGVAGMNSMKRVGRVGAKALLCFEVITTLALIIGMVLVEFWQPGSELHITAGSVDTAQVSAMKEKVESAGHHTVVDFLMNIIPTTLVSPFTSGDTLQVLLVAILFAWALPSLGEKGTQMLSFIDILSRILFRMMDIITLLAPIGAFGAITFAVGRYGVASLKNLGELLGIFYLACALFILLVMGPIMRFYCGLSVWKFLAFLKEEIFIVLGTSSSESVLPRLMEKLEKLGVSRPIVGMVVPAGYSFNLVGSSIYFTMGAMFIIYATHTPFSLWQELSLLGVLLVASKGAAGVSGSAFIVMAATLSTMHIMPQEQLNVGLAFIYGLDRFMSTGRAITNLIGNGISALVVAKWEGELDAPLARRMLERGSAEL
jgi:aerobic C4-dicarboxylate transport protein